MNDDEYFINNLKESIGCESWGDIPPYTGTPHTKRRTWKVDVVKAKPIKKSKYKVESKRDLLLIGCIVLAIIGHFASETVHKFLTKGK